MGSKPPVMGRAAALGLGTALVILLRGVGGLTVRAPDKDSGAQSAEAKQSSANPHAAAQEAGRGREADNPAQIPPRGWKDIAWRVYEEIGKDRVLAVAAGVTFYLLLAAFPAVAAFVSLYGLVADVRTIDSHLADLAGFVPSGAVDIIGEQIKRVNAKGEGALGLAAFIGLALSLWSSNAGMKAIFDALNVAYGEEEKRNFFVLNATSLAFTFLALAFMVCALGAVVAVPIFLEAVGLGSAGGWILWIGRWPALLLLIVFSLAVLYRYGPSRDRARWVWLTPGAAVASLAWIGFSMGFSWYVSGFGSYDETYGSLGAAIGFMTWMWLSTTILLVGAELNAEVEHQTAKDSTEGAPAPLGTRGAEMADNVGRAAA